MRNQSVNAVLTRRAFNAGLASAAVAGTSMSGLVRAQAGNAVDTCFFSKPFQRLSFDELGAVAAQIGITGLEFPLRARGHIEPDQASKSFPELMKALGKHQVRVPLIASSFNSPDDAHIQDTLKVCVDHGVKCYRLKYFKYKSGESLRKQIGRFNDQMKRLAELNAKIGIVGVYQNHAGSSYVGAPVWDLPMVLDGVDPNHIGLAFDIRHAIVEGGQSWPLSYQVIKSQMKYAYVKDMNWVNKKPSNCPLGEGHVTKKFFDMLKKDKYTGPYSLHVEYDKRVKGKASKEALAKNLEFNKAAFQKDHQTLLKWLG